MDLDEGPGSGHEDTFSTNPLDKALNPLTTALDTRITVLSGLLNTVGSQI